MSAICGSGASCANDNVETNAIKHINRLMNGILTPVKDWIIYLYKHVKYEKFGAKV